MYSALEQCVHCSQLEEHEGLRKFYGDGIAESLRHIVGVQFRNQATVGGSIYGRYGFLCADCITGTGTFVELYNGGLFDFLSL